MKLLDQVTAIAGSDSVSSWTEPASGLQLPLVTPADEEQCVELIQFAALDRLALIPIGFGSKTAWNSAAGRVDFALSTRRLSGVIAYEPGDGTITARAGTAISELRDVVSASGHRLTPDVPNPEGATLGGVISAGQSGFDRLRFGPMRNHVLGLNVLLGNGSQARSGGRLVKNVTGYDLHRLYTGAHGSLCVILEASMRLFPRAEDELLFEGHTGELRSAFELAASAASLPLTWDTLSIVGNGEGYSLIGALSGRHRILKDHVRDVESCLAGLEQLTLTTGEESRLARERARDAELTRGWPHLRLLTKPSELAHRAALLLDGLSELGETRPTLHMHPSLGTLDMWLSGEDVTARSERLFELREVAIKNQLRLQWLGSRQDFPDQLETLPPKPAALALMRKLQAALDPGGVFARGRVHGGL